MRPETAQGHIGIPGLSGPTLRNRQWRDKEEKKEDLIGESDTDVNLISLFLFLIYNLLMITSNLYDI